MGERRLRGRGNLLVLNGEEYRRPLLLNFPRPPTGHGWHLEGPGVRSGRARPGERRVTVLKREAGCWLQTLSTPPKSPAPYSYPVTSTHSQTMVSRRNSFPFSCLLSSGLPALGGTHARTRTHARTHGPSCQPSNSTVHHATIQSISWQPWLEICWVRLRAGTRISRRRRIAPAP
jgi:hypothetical protein